MDPVARFWMRKLPAARPGCARHNEGLKYTTSMASDLQGLAPQNQRQPHALDLLCDESDGPDGGLPLLSSPAGIENVALSWLKRYH